MMDGEYGIRPVELFGDCEVQLRQIDAEDRIWSENEVLESPAVKEVCRGSVARSTAKDNRPMTDRASVAAACDA